MEEESEPASTTGGGAAPPLAGLVGCAGVVRTRSPTAPRPNRLPARRRTARRDPALSPPITPRVEQSLVHGGIVVFRRSISLAVTFGGMFSPARPVRNTGTRSQVRSMPLLGLPSQSGTGIP